MKIAIRLILALAAAATMSSAFALGGAGSGPYSEPVRLKELGHIDGVRDNALVGYGLVVGLAGTGDSSQSGETLQSIGNALTRFGVRVSPDEISARNVAAVIVTATLPKFPNVGDKIDINVASMGDARSLVGGTLMLAPLHGADDKVYALAQGAISVGGFRYDAFGNVVQKNHPTVGEVPGGATIESTVPTSVVSGAGNLFVVLDDPDYITAGRVADAINATLPPLEGQVLRARAVDAGRIAVHLTETDRADLVHVIGRIESAEIMPDQTPRIVVNERTGTVVSGGDVRIGAVTVTHGELKVTVATDYLVSQPVVVGESGRGVQTAIVPQADLKIDEGKNSPVVSLPAGTSVSDLVFALNKIKVSPRDMISILEAIKRAGSLRAELVVE